MKRSLSFIAICSMVIIGWSINATVALSANSRWLAQEQILLYGLGLQAEPAHQTVPKDIATVVSTYLQAPDTIPQGVLPIPADAEVRATLRGPSLPGPVELVTRVNEHFEISPLQRAGIHTLENIRILHEGTVVLYASPESVTIEVIDQLLVTEITTRALTAEEIKNSGIIFDASNFQAYNFTAAFAVEPGEEIQLDFPILLPRLGSATDVPLEAITLPGLSGPGLKTVATIVPDTLKLAQTKIPNLSVKTFTFDVEAIEHQGFEIAPIIGTIVIPGDIGFLNQYFSVMLMVGNAAPENAGLFVQDLQAEIVLPAGIDDIVGSPDDPLAMALTEQGPEPRTQTVSQAGPDGKLGTADDINSLAPGDSGNAEFLVEGRREGSHVVEMEISGTLTGLPVGPVTVHGRAAGAVLVRNPSFTLTFTHPDVVNDGETYDLDVTITNTSASPANFVSVNLYPHHISGAVLVDPEDNTREIESIPPGDSSAINFKLRSQVTGTVYAATLDSVENVAGRFQLKTSVGELGIALSPDSLVLPKEAGALPESLRRAGVALLGKAYAAATAPVLPADVQRFSKQMVWDRAVEVAAAGLRYSLHEALSDTAKHLLFDFAGNNFTRWGEAYPESEQASDLEAAQKDFIGFDDLRRRSFRGDVWAAAIAALLSEDLTALGPAVFHRQWAETVSYRPGHLSVVLSSDSGPLPFNLILEDDQGLGLGPYDAQQDKIIKEIAFSDYLTFTDAQDNTTAQMALVAVPRAAAYTIKLERIPETPADIPATLSIVLPADTPSGLRQVVFSDVIPGGDIPVIEILPGDAFALDVKIYDAGQPAAGSDLLPISTESVDDPPPAVISVVQQAQADIVGCGGTGGFQLGRVAAVLFTEEVTAESVQDQFDRIDITHYTPQENEAVAVARQPGGRIVFLALRDSIGPFEQRQMTITDAQDLRGQIMEPWTGDIEATIAEEGCVISGQVLQADGTPVEYADIRLFFDNGKCGWYGVSAKHADLTGSYGWDFALQNRRGKIVAIDPLTQESRSVQFDAGRHGQRLNINIVFLGRGAVSGRVLAEDGFTVLPGAQIRVTSLNDYSRYGGQSDDAGRYLITDVPTGSILIEAVHPETNARTTQSAIIAFAGETVEKDLLLISEQTRVITADYGSISGHVLEADDLTPIPEVPVIVYYRSGSQEGVVCPIAGPPFFDCPVAFATTDANGAFAFEDIPAGELRVYSFEQARLVEGQARIQLPAEGSEEVNVLISGGLGTVSGVVLDADGSPVAGAVVGGGLSLTTTDAEGRFTLSDLPVGHRLIVAVSDSIGSQASAAVDLVAEDEEIYATLILPGVGNVVGTIYQPDGVTPVSNLEIYLWQYAAAGGEISVVASAITDSDGTYAMEDVPEGDSYTLSAFLPDMSMGNLVPVSILAHGQTVQADLTFIGRGRITGMLVDDDGQTPLQGQVALNELRVVRAGPVAVRFQYTQFARMVDTDLTSGAFVFDNVFVGSFLLTAAGPFSPHPVLQGGTMPFDGAEVDVVMQLQPTSTVTGTVYLSDGVTPAGSDLAVHFRGYKIVCYPDAGCFERPEGIQELTALTDDVGKFVFPLVNAGKFELKVEKESTGEFAQVRGTVAAGGTAEVDLRLLALRDVLVRVRGSDGISPISGAAVTINHAVVLEVEQGLTNNAGYLAIERSGTANVDGEILFAGGDALPEGELVVLAQNLDNGFAGRTSARIVPADPLDPTPLPVEVDVYLYDAAGSVYGTVFGPDGLTPVPNAEVIISNTQGSLAFLITDAAGAYRFDLIPLGEFEVRVFEAATGRRGIGSGQIFTDGQEVGLNITQAAMGYVTGTLLSAGERAPLVGWPVEIRQPNPWADLAGPGAGRYTIWRCTTGPDGRFDFPGISLGTFTLIAEKAGDRAQLESRITYDGEVIDIPVIVTLSQDPTGTIAGIVYHPDGSPAANFAVCLDRCPPYGPGTSTDAFGAFRFEEVSLGRYDILAQSQDGTDAGRAEVELTYAGETAAVSVVLGGVGRISGTVERQDGSPVPGVSIHLGPKPTDLTQYTSPAGTFDFIQLATGTYTLAVVDQPSGQSGSARVVLAPAEELSVRVVLAPAHSITGLVTFSNAAPALPTCRATRFISSFKRPNSAPRRLRKEMISLALSSTFRPRRPSKMAWR